MTLSTTAPIQSPACTRNGPYPPPPLLTQGPPSERGYSDSALPSCRMSADKLASLSHDPSTAVMSIEPEPSQDLRGCKRLTLPDRRKAKSDLRLSSFQELGLATPSVHPTALLTPPDETTLSGINPLDFGTSFLPQSQPLPTAVLPDTPEGSDTTPQPLPMAAVVSSPDFVTVTTPQGSVSQAQSQSSVQFANIPTVTSPGTSFGDPIGLVSKFQHSPPLCFDLMPTRVASVATSHEERTLYNVLCHSQPCPLPSESNPTTAFNDLVTNLQQRIPFGSYIEITHAIPLGFNIDKVPHSPSATPNILNQNEPTDYFSIQNTFSKAVIATSYQDALESSVPSSPHPIVAPSTVHISLLERYIPPIKSHEFKDLFSTEAPSALVNRLTELSSEKGCLMFVYPTKTGAHTFHSNYLGPLLHPLLRRMAGVHGLASDLGTNIAKAESPDHLLSFEDMKRKLDQLLRNLSRPRSLTSAAPAAHRSRTPKFEVIHSSARRVQLDRKSWQDWYLHQEKPRIQKIVSNYFGRGFRLPTQSGVTAGAICREIMEGLVQQDYLGPSPPRDGVEVGVYVVQRTA